MTALADPSRVKGLQRFFKTAPGEYAAGDRFLGIIKAAAVFVGAAGVGPWQEQELYGLLREFVSRRSPVIPILLPDAPDKPELPVFLKAMTWVDFRLQDPDPLSRLIWGITGQRPGSSSSLSP